MKLNGTDKLLMLIYASILVFSIVKLLTVESEFRGQEIGIAKVESFNGDLRGMDSRDLAWKNLDINQNLGPGDKIVTGQDTKAVLLFDSGIKLELLPKTLIVLEKQNVQVASGEVKVTVLKKQGSSQIKINGNIVKESGNVVSLSQENKNQFEELENSQSSFITKLECGDEPAPEFQLSNNSISFANNSLYSKFILFDQSGKNELISSEIVNSFEVPKKLLDEVGYISFHMIKNECDFKTPLQKIAFESPFMLDELQASLIWKNLKLFLVVTSKKVFNPNTLPISLEVVTESGELVGHKTRPLNGELIEIDSDNPPKKIIMKSLDDEEQNQFSLTLPSLESPVANNKNVSLDKTLEQLVKMYPSQIEFRPLLQWERKSGHFGFQVDIFEKIGTELKRIKKIETKDNKLIWPLTTINNDYYYRITPFDRFGNAGKVSELYKINMESM